MRHDLCLWNEITVDSAMVHIDSMQDTKCGMVW